MDLRAIGDYGGPYSDYAPVEDPETELASDKANLFLEDVAQLTRTAPRAIIQFNTISATAPQTASVVGARTLWGTGVSFYPAVSKTADGTYTVTLDATYEDGLGTTETVSLFGGHANAGTAATGTFCQVDASSNAATVLVYRHDNVLWDAGGGKKITVFLY